MSPERGTEVRQVEGFPRMRGDEPGISLWWALAAMFSPHARG